MSIKMQDKPRNKLFSKSLDCKDIIEKMKPGTKKEQQVELWDNFYHGVNTLKDSDWWIELGNIQGARETEDEFLRDREESK